MNAYSEIKAALPGRPRWQLVAFAAGCAERLVPMAASLGGAPMAEAAEAGVALAWEAAVEHTAQPQVEQAINELTLVLDAPSQDPEGPQELGAHALNVAVFALETAIGAFPTDSAQAACSGGLDLVGQVDFALAHLPLEAPMVIDMDEEEPPGPLEAREIEAQRVAIRLLGAGGDQPDPDAIEAVRRLSKARAAELARAMPEFIRRWSLGLPQPQHGAEDG